MEKLQVRKDRRGYYGAWSSKVVREAGFEKQQVLQVSVEYLPRSERVERRWGNLVQKLSNKAKQKDFSNLGKWFVRREERPDASVRLLCLPWAGGNSSAFARWHEYFPDYDVISIELPGRMTRSKEPLVGDVEYLVHNIAMAMHKLGLARGKPFVLYGHSFGAVLAYELAVKLFNIYRRVPLRLIVSGCRAPQHIRFQEAVSRLTLPEQIEHLRQLGGIPAVILERRELLNIFLPTILADYSALDEYQYSQDNTPLQCPVLVLDAQSDDIPEDEINDWELVSDKPFTLMGFPGTHYFIKEHPQAVLSEVLVQLEKDYAEFQESLSLGRRNR